LRRIKLLLAVIAAMSLMMMVSAPAMANDLDRDCFPFCDDHHHNGHHDFDRHDFFIDEFDEFEDFDDLDDCEFIGWDGDEAIYVCEVDFDW
jgi:hypothetical protein